MKKLALFLALVLMLGVLGAPATAMEDGAFQGAAKGNNADLVVEVVVEGGAIAAVTVLEHSETPGICDRSLVEIPEAIVAAQGLGVDVLSGATNTGKAILEAAALALEAAGADVEALKAIGTAEVEQKADETIETEVLVIGAGGAGCAAGVQANQLGAKVIIIEKQASVGGNTILSGGALNAVNDRSEQALAYDDSVEWHYTQTMNGGDNQGDPLLVHTLVRNAYAGVEWLQEMGMSFEDDVSGLFTVTGGMWPRAHKPSMPVGTGFFDTYQRYIDGHEGIEIMLNTKAESFITDETGKILGVKATGETGNTITFLASKGVVLASGGFGRNVELRTKYDNKWGCLDETILSTNSAGATGDGIYMAAAVGADLVGMEHIQLLPLGDPATGSLSGNIEHDVERRIFVNKEGNRFVNEGGRRDEMTEALFAQTDSWMWIIMDSDCYPAGDELNNFGEPINQLIAEGRAFKGETLEDLAAAIDVPAENLVASVNAFNEHVASGEKDEFGRTLYSTPIDNGPFYAGPRVPTVHHTMGGVRINAKAEVIDRSGNVIDGLYAAGEVTGGIHGSNRLGGNALTDILVFGRIAGENVAAR